MTVRTTPEIDFSTFPSSDGEPMAETLANAVQMVDLQWVLQTLFARQGRAQRVTVGGNQFVYYNQHDGRDHVSPDVYVIFDVAPPAPPKWQTWIEGKFPDIVFEISSASTAGEDVGTHPRHKPALYARLGAREYYVYDPQGDLDPPLRGFRWREDGVWAEAETLASGGIWSPLLGAELRPAWMPQTERRPAGRWLRVIDPTMGQPIMIADEEHRAFEEQVDRLRQEEHARRVAEERAARAEAALHALLAQQERPGLPAVPGDNAETGDLDG